MALLLELRDSLSECLPGWRCLGVVKIDLGEGLLTGEDLLLGATTHGPLNRSLATRRDAWQRRDERVRYVTD